MRHLKKYIALLFYVVLWSEQKFIAGNIMKKIVRYIA